MSKDTFFQVEPGFFLALSVSVPSSRKPGKDGEQVGIIFMLAASK